MIVIEKEEVEQKLTMPICIGLMRTAMADLASGRAFQPLRTIHVLPGGNLYAFMPAYLGENDYFGAKVLTQFKGNLGTGWPSHMGYVQICESVHGSTVGMVDADSITAIRTGAAAGVGLAAAAGDLSCWAIAPRERQASTPTHRIRAASSIRRREPARRSEFFLWRTRLPPS